MVLCQNSIISQLQYFLPARHHPALRDSGPARFTRHTSGAQAAGREVSEPSSNKTLKIIFVIFLYLNLSAFICVHPVKYGT
jgi:hypothetical protein